jgi:hypothetical protein
MMDVGIMRVGVDPDVLAFDPGIEWVRASRW